MVGHRIERASLGDAVELVGLRDRLASWLQVRGIRQWLAGEFALDRMNAWIGDEAVDVCRVDGEIRAAVAVLWDDPIWPDRDRGAGYIHLLMVDRRSAGGGLGDVMLTHAEQRIRQAGCLRSRLDAVSANPVLQQWYGQRGYRPVGTVHFDQDDLFDTTLFEKALPLLPPDAAHPAVEEVEVVLQAVTAWAASQADVRAVGLAGSWARAEARPDSDVDLVLIVDDVQSRLVDDRWLAGFGDIATVAREDWGAVQFVRVGYRGGLEVEFGLTTGDWLQTPLDTGTVTVIADGFLVLYDREGAMSDAVHRVGAR